MIDNIGAGRIPKWLARGPAIPLRSLLKDSVFYPGSWYDFDPVIHLGNRFPSFVYADYRVPQEATSEALRQLRGYQVVLMREVSMEELGLPREINEPFGGNVVRDVVAPYALWAILERLPDAHADDMCPTRISMLFVGAEAVAVFQGLYVQNGRVPAVVALIQVGVEWTDFKDAEGPMAEVVLSNPTGRPEYLLQGGDGPGDYYMQPFWPLYSESVWSGSRFSRVGSLHLWRRP